MSENLKIPSQEIKEIITKLNLNSTEVGFILADLKKEMDFKEFTQEVCNELPKAMKRHYLSNCSVSQL